MPGDQLRVQIEPTNLAVRPGSQAPVQVRVVNISGIVDTFEVSLVGTRHPGLSAEPQRAKLLKNQEKVVPLMVKADPERPPPAGTRVVGIRITSLSNSSISQVEEVQLSVPAVGAPVMTVEPQRVKGGEEATLHARVTNSSNQPVNLGFSGTDPEHAVDFEFHPQATFVAPGEVADVMVKVSAASPFTGVEVHRMLSINASDGQVQLSGVATFMQSPRVSPGLLRVLGAVAGLVLLGGTILAAAFIASRGGDDDQLAGPIVGGTVQAPDGATTAPLPPVEQLATVPQVVGLDVNVAGQALAAAGLTPAIVPKADDAVAGTVLEVQPSAGSQIAPLSSVSLTVSSGAEALPTAKVPELAGLTAAEANVALATACAQQPCLSGLPSTEFNDDTPPNRIVGSAPSAGETVDAGTAVAYVVSLGPQPEEPTPSVVTPIIGDWVNATPSIGPITRLIVDDAGGQPLVRGFKRCGTEECAIGGQVLGAFNGTNGSIEVSDTDFRYLVTFKLNGGALDVETKPTWLGTSLTFFTLDPSIFAPQINFPLNEFPVLTGTTITLPPTTVPQTVAVFKRS